MRLTPRDVRTVSSAPDLDLVVAARGGSVQAREALFRRHVQMVTGLAFRLCGRYADAHQVTAELFRSIAATGWDLPHPEALRPWLVCALTKLVGKTIWKAQLRTRLRLKTPTSVRFEAALEAMPAEGASELRRFYGRVDRLSPRTRALIILRHLEGLSLPEIAMALELPVGTVRRLLARAERKVGWRRPASTLPQGLALTSSRF